MADRKMIQDGAVIACTACDWSSADMRARHDCPNDPKVLQAKLEEAERDVKEVQAAREWIDRKTGVGGGPEPLSFLIASHEYMVQERAAAWAQRDAAESALAAAQGALRGEATALHGIASMIWGRNYASLDGVSREIDKIADRLAALAAESGKPGGDRERALEEALVRLLETQAWSFSDEQAAAIDHACDNVLHRRVEAKAPDCLCEASDEGRCARYMGGHLPKCPKYSGPVPVRPSEPRAAPPALPAELSGKGEQPAPCAFEPAWINDDGMSEYCSSCGKHYATHPREPGEAKKEEA